MADRPAFLDQVRAALGARGGRADGPPPRMDEDRFRVQAARQRAAAQWEALWGRFERELQAVGGQGHCAADVGVAAAVIGGLAAERGAHRLVTWDLEALGFAGLAEPLIAAGLEVVNAAPPRVRVEDAAQRADLRAQLAAADLGITGADYAVAETGTLLLISGEGRSRLVSLLPRIHVALVRPAKLVGSLRDMQAILALEHREGRAADASCLNFITGVSKSADIEFSLARGVHGPGEVHVILIAEK